MLTKFVYDYAITSDTFRILILADFSPTFAIKFK
nr:MAG TPA: type VI secretion protein [Caudoviricetes sp.]